VTGRDSASSAQLKRDGGSSLAMAVVRDDSNGVVRGGYETGG
jgi:hypothetical protein